MPAGQVLFSAVASSGQMPPARKHRHIVMLSCGRGRVRQGAAAARGSPMPRTTATRPVIASSVTGSRWPIISPICSVRMVCGQSTITNDHCCKPFSGVGATRRRRSGSACMVVVKATTVARAHQTVTPQPAEPCRREAAPRPPCRVAAAWALLPSQHVLEGICEPAAASASASAVGRAASSRQAASRRAR